MSLTYYDLITQTHHFPQEGFDVKDNELYFNDIPMLDIIKQYGTPTKLSYLPKIGQQIQKARRMFNVAMAKTDYKGNYYYCYCTKSSHFSFVLDEVLKNGAHIETSSAYDIYIVKKLFEQNKISKETYIVCNGYKPQKYKSLITELANEGFNIIPVLDHLDEIDYYKKHLKTDKCQIGIRIATEEEPSFPFYTSRLGIRYSLSLIHI